MKKEMLIVEAERLHEEAKQAPLMYLINPDREKITEVSFAIIKTICEQEGITPDIVIDALTMVKKTIKKEMMRDPIL